MNPDSKLSRRFELLMSRLANYHALEAYCVQHYGVWSCFYRCETYAGEIMLGSNEEQATQLVMPGT